MSQYDVDVDEDLEDADLREFANRVAASRGFGFLGGVEGARVSIVCIQLLNLAPLCLSLRDI